MLYMYARVVCLNTKKCLLGTGMVGDRRPVVEHLEDRGNGIAEIASQNIIADFQYQHGEGQSWA